MRRALIWGIAGVVLALAIIGGFAFDRAITRWYVSGDAPQSQAVPAASGVPVEIAYTYLDGTVVRYVLVDAPQPTPPAPTLTPTAPPTNTPRPTATPPATATTSATVTRTPTQTPIPASPTPRATATPPASETPVPTPTPEGTPILDSCMGIPAVGWYIRAAPGGAALGYFSDLDRPDPALPGIAVQTFRLLAARDYEGARWYAFWFDTGVIGWTHEGAWTLAGACDTLPTEPPVQEVRAPFRMGGHFISPVNENSLFGDYGACRNGNERLCYILHETNPDALITYRSLTNCGLQTDGPELWQWYTPSVWAACVVNDSPPGFDYYEIINERDPPDMDWVLFVDWTIDVCAYLNAYGMRCAAFSFGPGNPADFAAWGELWRYVEWANANPLPDGSYNAIAWHQAGYAAPGVEIPPEDRWQVSNPWIAGRDRMVDVWLQQHRDVSLADFRGRIFVTELYFGDNWTCDNLADSIAYTADRYSERVWLRGGGGAVWNFGGDGEQWVNHTACRDAIQNRL